MAVAHEKITGVQRFKAVRELRCWKFAAMRICFTCMKECLNHKKMAAVHEELEPTKEQEARASGQCCGVLNGNINTHDVCCKCKMTSHQLTNAYITKIEEMADTIHELKNTNQNLEKDVSWQKHKIRELYSAIEGAQGLLS